MNSLTKSKNINGLDHRSKRSLSVPPKYQQILPTNDSQRNEIEDIQKNLEKQLRFVPANNLKYTDVWKRVRIKLRTQLVLKKLLQTGVLLSKTNTNTHIEVKTEDDASIFTIQKPSVLSDNWTNEAIVYESIPCYLFHPRSKVKSAWNVIIALLLLYTISLMPFTMAFYTSTPGDIWDDLDLITDGLFFGDFLINCFSAYYDKSETLITNHKTILFTYLKSWMLIDLVSCFPFTLLDYNQSQQQYYSGNKYNNFLRLLRLPKLYRLFRLSRLLKLLKHYNNAEFIEKIQEYFSIKNSAMRLIKSFFIIALCLHLAACLWFFSSRIDGFNPDTWVVRYGFLDYDVPSKYLVSVYWAFTTLTTVGYGDISGYTNLEKIICISWMICGLYFFSFTIGSLSSMMSSIDTKENVLLGKLAVIDEFSIEANLSKDLRNKLKHALRYSAEKRGFSWLDKLSIFNELPKPLRYEVAINMHHGAAKEISFFKKKDQSIIAAIVPLLQPMFLERNEYVYKKGEFADEIYFIVKGRISYVFGKEDTVLKSMQKGSYFGDIEVVKGISRKYSAKGVRSTELLIMHKQVVEEIIEEHPNVWEEIKEVALKREKINERAIVELQELIRLRNNGELEGINVAIFKKRVEELFEERNQHHQEKNQIYTLKDLDNRIDILTKILKNEELPAIAKQKTFFDDNNEEY